MRLFQRDTKMEALKRAPLFEGLSKKELSELAKMTEDLEVEPGTVLCREGASGHEFLVLVDGEVEVTKGGKRVATRGGGDFVGEIALMLEVPRTATVTARTPVRFFVLSRQGFRSVLDHNPRVERKVMRALARRVYDLAGDESF